MMMLARIEPDRPDHDRRTFECANCGHVEVLIAKCQ
jgi:transcription elongation factor Elf1